MMTRIVLFVGIAILSVVSLWVLDPVFQVFDRPAVSNASSQQYSIVESQSIRTKEIDLSVIFPAFNEEKRFPSTIDSALNFLRNWTSLRGWNFEIIVVDDGSTDATTEIAKQYFAQHPDIFRVITLRKNRGKGGAVKVGVNEALGKYILMADADGATEISDLAHLMSEMESLEAENAIDGRYSDVGMVIGSRAHLAKKSIATREFHRTVLMKGFHLLVMMLCTRQIQDTQCGFKLFTRKVARALFGNLHLFRWAFDIELIYQAEAVGIAMKEVSVNWREVEGSKLIRNKFDIITTSITMARDMLAVRLAYVLGFWKLPNLEIEKPTKKMMPNEL